MPPAVAPSFQLSGRRLALAIGSRHVRQPHLRAVLVEADSRTSLAIEGVDVKARGAARMTEATVLLRPSFEVSVSCWNCEAQNVIQSTE